MFDKKTLFIIGAGVSYEVGLPLGAELLQNIRKLVTSTGHRDFSDARISTIIRRTSWQSRGTNQRSMITAFQKLHRAIPGFRSIDNLLHAHFEDQDLVLAGKVSIAIAISQAEKSSEIYTQEHETIFQSRRDYDFGWYGRFFRKLTEGVPVQDLKNSFSKVSFINFNYDRVLEKFIRDALVDSYMMSFTEANDIVRDLDIIHPYGSLGDIISGMPDYWYYGFGDMESDWLQVAERINTFTEGLYNSQENEAIDRLFEESERWVFVGFSFGEQNMKILKGKNETSKADVRATVYNVSDVNSSVILSKLDNLRNKRVPGNQRYGDPFLYNLTASALLDDLDLIL